MNGFDFTVTLFDGTQIKADLEFESPSLDIAVLKARSDGPFPKVKIGDSNTVRVGDPVFAIGNPLGLQNTVTHGIISALDRGINDSRFDNYMQTDTPINPSNSGGPLFNDKGEVIGINIEIFTRHGGSIGLGFVGPGNVVLTVSPKNAQVQSFIRSLHVGDQVDIVYEEALAISVTPMK